MSPDPWGRNQLPSAADDAADVMGKYEHQLELQLNKTIEATPEQLEEWYETELKWWGEQQFKIIIIATIVQISALGFMAAIMLLNGVLFK